jgi:lysophospholipase L1-like esterase
LDPDGTDQQPLTLTAGINQSPNWGRAHAGPRTSSPGGEHDEATPSDPVPLRPRRRLLGPPAALAEHEDHAVHYDVALGDSLAAGPERGGDANDYPEQLFVNLRKADPNLRLVRFGCGGETTASTISASLPWEGRGERYLCSYANGSQLAVAVRFLRAHRQFVSLVTIDIGANDVLFCVAELDQTCLAEGLTAIEQNLPLILSALRAAAGADVPILGMNYHNPFLAFWFASPHA